MTAYVLRRLAFLVAMMWAAVTLNFLIPRLMPGNPAEVMLAHIGAKGPVTPQLREQLAASLGLPGGSLISQYGHYLANVVRFRFGISYYYFPERVSTLVWQALPWTLLLVGTVTVISFLAGSALGVTAAWRRNRKFDAVSTVGSTFVSSFPLFWIGLLLLYVFAFRLKLLPLTGGSSNSPSWTVSFIGDALRHSVLPGLSIFLSGLGGWALGMRNYTINVLGEDYIRFAQVNGVRTRTILLRYAARNAVLPQLTLFAIVFGNVVGGSLLVEEVFGYPGVGTLMYNAVFNLDYPLMQALFLIITVSVLVANFLVDLLHLKLDPKDLPVNAARALWRQRKARTGVLIIAAFAVLAALAPVLSPYSPKTSTFTATTGPSGAHLLGTTGGGQDVLSQLLYGTRDSLLVGLAAALGATAVALVVGLVAGYLAGATDAALNFLMNVFLVIPALPLMIIISTYRKSGGVWMIVLVIVLTGWAFGGRVVRSRVMTLRSLDFVTAARFSGDRRLRVIGREILPNMASLVALLFFSTATGAVLAEAGLEFLGLGNPATVSWGTMLYWAQTYNVLLEGQWVGIVAPGLCIAVLASAFSLVNFAVDELSNPRLREG